MLACVHARTHVCTRVEKKCRYAHLWARTAIRLDRAPSSRHVDVAPAMTESRRTPARASGLVEGMVRGMGTAREEGSLRGDGRRADMMAQVGAVRVKPVHAVCNSVCTPATQGDPHTCHQRFLSSARLYPARRPLCSQPRTHARTCSSAPVCPSCSDDCVLSVTTW